ncbi:MAG: hypothetical protein ACP5N1_00770 [Candidatus Woesearchaeota archaeon]
MNKKTNNKKGQAAMEFLITYGWAIMAAMMVIGALTYFGMSNPATSLPDKCLFSNVFECKDYKLNSTELNVQLVNIAGESIYGIPNMMAIITSTGSGCIIDGNPTIIEPEDRMNITCKNIPDSPLDKGEKVKIRLTVSYAKNPGGYTQVSLGEVYTTVQ